MLRAVRPRWRRPARHAAPVGRGAAAALLLALAAGPAAAQPPGAALTLRVYFNNAQRAGTQADCAMVFERTRELPHTSTVAAAALQQLFAGPTEAERAAGDRSPFSAATAGLLKRVTISDSTAHVDLHDLRAHLPGVTSSCGAAEFGVQIERTLRQFPTVRRVILALDGEPRRFAEWMGQDCDQRNDHCDPAPFRAARRPGGLGGPSVNEGPLPR